jgi:hypothetical protein
MTGRSAAGVPPPAFALCATARLAEACRPEFMRQAEAARH